MNTKQIEQLKRDYPGASDKFYENSLAMSRCFELLPEFYTNEEIVKWLNSPHELLGGETAMSLFIDGRAKEVLRVVEGLESLPYL